jgi:hypothetical protein
VDVITPPRLASARFAAVSLYLCHANEADTAPSFFVLEAGVATGQARIPFLGRTMASVINAQTQYSPTSFSQPWHYYRGTLAMKADAPDEPSTLIIEVFTDPPPDGKYLEVIVQYESRADPVMTNPFQLTVEAGARVQAIADALGVPSGLEEQWFLRLVADVELGTLFTITPKRQA